MQAALELNRELNLKNRMFLHATPVERINTPIPFYVKLGFKCPDERIQQDIEKGIVDLKNTGVYTGPEYTVMYLSIPIQLQAKKIKQP